ncbi:hypothetical protein PYR71_16820 [Rhizobium sp. MC63]|uniref:Uncharacterized protein n=1 Tax=Rhizobium mulingense TaxID=3031128 RepID=A0ACC6MXC5_9HYPH|nr:MULTISPECIES: hypothetical protein [unclassified Rhizobium]MDF0698136.1 hypothetical protein [Rhizobium sp. MC63]MEA3517999.1 hypothetical protein [Rhizobium sp. MJ31]
MNLNAHFLHAVARNAHHRSFHRPRCGAGGILFKARAADYAVGKLTRGKAGGYGWVVSNGSKQFFCRVDASLAYVSRKEMVSILSSGRLVKLDRAAFEASIGGPDPSIPQWSDLQAGRVKPADVGSCTPTR